MYSPSSVECLSTYRLGSLPLPPLNTGHKFMHVFMEHSERPQPSPLSGCLTLNSEVAKAPSGGQKKNSATVGNGRVNEFREVEVLILYTLLMSLRLRFQSCVSCDRSRWHWVNPEERVRGSVCRYEMITQLLPALPDPFQRSWICGQENLKNMNWFKWYVFHEHGTKYPEVFWILIFTKQSIICFRKKCSIFWIKTTTNNPSKLIFIIDSNLLQNLSFSISFPDTNQWNAIDGFRPNSLFFFKDF